MSGVNDSWIEGCRSEDLSLSNWDDFERFFSKYGGVQDACWCVYYNTAGAAKQDAGAEKYERNRRLKKELVAKGLSHNILIYSGADVIASCQYGIAEELSRIDGKKRYRDLGLKRPEGRLWRITCFFVDRKYRHRGAAKLALMKTLEIIAEKGGGTVEAYPVIRKNGAEAWFGTLNMYLEEGFSEVNAFGSSNALVRKEIQPR